MDKEGRIRAYRLESGGAREICLLKTKSDNLFYEINGKGDNSLIFIHGLCGSHNVWSKNIPAFTSKYRVLAIDMFGHGNSSKDISPKEAFEFISFP